MDHPKKQSLMSKLPGEKTKANILLFLSFILFLIGIFAPVLTFQKFFIFSSKVSIITGLFQLLTEGYPILFVLIFGFSIVLPFFKLLLLFGLVNGLIHNPEKHRKILNWIAQYGKWSMLDVFVAALLIVTIRLGAMADVKVHFGLYAFAASVILAMIATSKVMKRVSQ
ncbi:paraquat-inducible protein A [bacterium]|nr:paraquat-inducible protein A [bacterium]